VSEGALGTPPQHMPAGATAPVVALDSGAQRAQPVVPSRGPRGLQPGSGPGGLFVPATGAVTRALGGQLQSITSQ